MSVYFITARATGMVKIGKSNNPQRRIQGIQTHSPYRLKLEAMLPGDQPEERALHARFAEHRIEKEWFTIVPEIEEIIAANPPFVAEQKVKPKPERRGGPWRRGECPREREARIVAEERAIAIEAGMKWLRSLEGKGSITFPFRELGELEGAL